jgi:hypothetical protein
MSKAKTTTEPEPIRFAPNLGVTKIDPRIRCMKCGTLLVGLVDYVKGSVQGYGERPRQTACPKCDGPLERVSELRALYRRVGKEGNSP